MLPAMLIILLVWNRSLPPAYLLYAAIGAALIWLTHADNIQRLLSGTERKFDFDLLAGRRAR
jgi:glycerol-3-phosphate acyltransferase PlsY